MNIDPDPKTNEPLLIPAIYLSLWQIQAAKARRRQDDGSSYTRYDNTFEANWEVVA